jgi:DNA-binding SARP family transcriptional activator
VQICILGPLRVLLEGDEIPLPRRQQRALLAALALRAGEVVSTERLIDDLWGERPPAAATGSLQNTVSALRKLLGREVLLTQAPGYRLALPAEAVDANRFESLLARAGSAEPAERAALLREALTLWRGPALADLDEEEFARSEAARLEELRITALEERVETELALGRHTALVGELEQLVAAHPLRERLRGQLMLALYRCGRQAEALEVYRATRLALADELGLEPSPELQELQRRMLQQDPSLTAPAVAAGESSPTGPSELRLVTVLAATPPSDDDPERHRMLLDETLAAVHEAIARHGGTPERFGPEGLVVIFGADAPSDDDAERAVRVAHELGLPAGIATGEAVDGAGAVFTRAAELARVGGVRLDERTAAIVGSARRLDRPLVGRGAELARLRSELAEARATGRSRVLTVVGEPGIGKTRLARELAALEGATATVLVARCVSHGTGAALLPLLGALRRAGPERALAEETDGDVVLARLAAFAGGEAPLGESYWAVRRLLEALARRAPVVLLLDDVHWAEPALLDLVDYLGDRADAPLLVLCLARPELERTPGTALALDPLDADGTRAIVTGTADLDEPIRERVVAAAEGNPLYAEQLASFAAESGEGLPPTLEAVLAGRLGRLQQAERTVLQRAAVLGREFTVGGVTALAQSEVIRELLSLTRAGFIHPAPAEPGDDGYTFHHVLLRDAAYAGLTKADRAELHERAAAWIDRDGQGDDALAGYHLEQAVRWRRELGEDADELAAAAGERLGDAGLRAWRAADDAAARGLLTRAVALLPPTRRRAELRWELAIAMSKFAEYGAAAATERARAAEEATSLRDDLLEARSAAESARARLWSGEAKLTDATAALTESIHTLERHADHRGLGHALYSLACVHLFACNLADVQGVAMRAASHYEAAGITSAASIGLLAEALYYGSTPAAQAEARCVELLGRASVRQAEASVTAVLGGLRGIQGSTDDGRTLTAHARRTFEDIGHPASALALLAPLEMDVEVSAGDLDAAVRIGRASFDALAEVRADAVLTTRAVQLADLLLDAGDPDVAEGFVAFAEEHALDSDVLVQFLSRSMRARLLARAGAHAEAEELARRAVAIAALTDVLRDRARAHLALADVLRLSGRNAEADAERDTATELLAAKGAVALIPARPTKRRGEPRRLPSRQNA